jgi:hypothetical protein
MRKSIETGAGCYELRADPIEPEAHERCAECGDLGPNDMLFAFTTVCGRNERRHDGHFCSTGCHDRWHGLKSRPLTHVWL